MVLLAKPPHPQKKNATGSAELRPADPVAFFKAAPPAVARGAGAKRVNEKKLAGR